MLVSDTLYTGRNRLTPLYIGNFLNTLRTIPFIALYTISTGLCLANPVTPSTIPTTTPSHVTVHLSWNPVTSRVNGSPFNPAMDLLYYEICHTRLDCVQTTNTAIEWAPLPINEQHCFHVRAVDLSHIASEFSPPVCSGQSPPNTPLSLVIHSEIITP